MDSGKTMVQYYDGSSLLNKKDLDGQTPEIFATVGNRTAGKTFYFKNYLVENYLKHKHLFIDIVRFKYEIPDRIDAFYEDLKQINYPDLSIDGKRMLAGSSIAHYLNGELAGYSIALSAADTIKKHSSLFVIIRHMLFDEFQSETMHYLSDEVTKFQSIHASVARGESKQSRYVPVFMCSNNVSILNPYFTAWGFTTRLNSQTKFLRGHGIVLQQVYNKSAAEAMKQSAFNRAFINSDYLSYAAENVAMNDNYSFIENVKVSDALYLYTIEYDHNKYALWQSAKLGIMFVNRKIDMNYPFVLTFKQSDHDINKMLILTMEDILIKWRKYFQAGLFRFSDIEAKNNMLDILAIR